MRQEAPEAPVVVAAGLPGTRHTLGLEFAGTAISFAGWRPVIVGGDLPISDILAAVSQTSADALLVSVSTTKDPREAHRELQALDAGLPADVLRLLGGAGAPDETEGWLRPESIMALVERAREPSKYRPENM